MALTQRLQLRQSQALVMTPQLMQAIKLLQLSNLDLIAYVEAELERNPLLEREDGGDDGPAERREVAEAPPAEHGAADADGEWMSPDLEHDAGAIEAKLDTDLGNVFPDD